ncbi:hypothetical protein C8R45DRAFT_1222739 [Mycena sanguinolenta]|nr:hypothetical protein C8R45DRAFT_1222739 [Mycena sanguinolenta]
MADAAELPNAFTPLAFLPPVLANQFEVSRYLYAATLGAYVWDIGLNLGNDHALLFKHKVRFPTIMYFLSRAFTLAFIITPFVFQVASVKHCNALAISFSICSVLSQITTAMLFFLRVTAVWHPNKIVYAVFSILWIAVLGAGITAPLGVRGAHIGPTMQCITTVVPGNVEAAAIVPMINDTAIFLAINYRILAHTIVADSFVARLQVFFGGNGLSTISRALIQSGQHFYLVAVATNITLLVVVKLPQLPPVYRAMLTVPGFALINAMACLVFRRIKFGLMSSDGTPTTGVSSDFRAPAHPRSLPLHYRGTEPTTTDTNFPLDDHVQKEIGRFENSAGQEISKSTTLV